MEVPRPLPLRAALGSDAPGRRRVARLRPRSGLRPPRALATLAYGPEGVRGRHPVTSGSRWIVPVVPLAPSAVLANAARSVAASASVGVSESVPAATLNASYAASVKASASFLARFVIWLTSFASRLASAAGTATSGLGYPL